MVSNLAAWLADATPLTDEEMQEVIAADAAANAHLYSEIPEGVIILEGHFPPTIFPEPVATDEPDVG